MRHEVLEEYMGYALLAKFIAIIVLVQYVDICNKGEPGLSDIHGVRQSL